MRVLVEGVLGSDQKGLFLLSIRDLVAFVLSTYLSFGTRFFHLKGSLDPILTNPRINTVIITIIIIIVIVIISLTVSLYMYLSECQCTKLARMETRAVRLHIGVTGWLSW